jgi:OOP family OmpA-OmpF porin
VQCGIAIGFTKSRTRDETSVSKCQMAYDMMMRPPVPLAPPPRPVQAPPPIAACSQQVPGMVFFDFDSASLPADARQTVEFVARNSGPCNWRNIGVVGHADRSGSNEYNVGLSQRRAQAVADLLTSMGVARASIQINARGEEQPRVPTADGVREAQNRRVEMTVR